MPYVAANPRNFIGTSVGNGQCVAFAREAAAVGHTQNWTCGVQGRGATLAPGAVNDGRNYYVID